MDYIESVYKLLKKCYWEKLPKAWKDALLVVIVMITGGIFYWLYDLLYQMLIQRM